MVITVFRPAVLNRHIASLDIAAFVQAVAKCLNCIHKCQSRTRVEKTNNRHCRLLRTRGERPRNRRTAEQFDELASSHCLTRRSEQGTVRAQLEAVDATGLLARSLPSLPARFCPCH